MTDSTDTKSHVSDELLNSFIDHQITNEERQELLALLNRDETLANRLCELQRLKQLTQLAYDDIPAPAGSDNRGFARKQPFPLAASIAIFSLGLLLGLGMMKINSSVDVITTPGTEQAQTKVLVHLTSADVDAGLNTLDNIQQMLQEYAANQQAVVIEVVANGNGIKLLSNSNRKIARRIADLTTQHANLSFAACKNTIDQIKITSGRDIQLIPQVKLIDSGIVNVIKRQQQGWTYIRG